MITTKRQIKRDSDRFGGYYTADTAGIPRISDYDDISNPDTVDEPMTGLGNSMLVSDIRSAQVEQPVYTAPPTAPSVAPEDRPAKQPPRSKEDLLPTIKTRKYATEQPAQDELERVEKAPVQRRHAVLDTKTKILLCVYVFIALALAIAVIATGVSISSAAAQADEIAVQVAQKQAVVLEQEKELALLQDADAIRGKAVVNGMVQAGEPRYTVGSVQSVGYPEPEERTDDFDKVMDWLDKVFH